MKDCKKNKTVYYGKIKPVKERDRMSKFSYQMNYDEASYTVTHYEGDSEEVVIPDSFLGKPVTILSTSVRRPVWSAGSSKRPG